MPTFGDGVTNATLPMMQGLYQVHLVPESGPRPTLLWLQRPLFAPYGDNSTARRAVPHMSVKKRVAVVSSSYAWVCIKGMLRSVR